jgi:hypothetical protein
VRANRTVWLQYGGELVNATKDGMKQPYMPITRGNRSNWRKVRCSFAKGGIPLRLNKHSDMNSHEEEEEDKDISFMEYDAISNVNNY